MTKRKPIVLLFSLFLFIWGNAQVSKTAHVTTPGTISTLLTQTELNTITDLTLTGNIDGRDFLVLKNNMPVLTALDLSAVTIKEFYSVYYAGGYSVTTFYEANTIQPLNTNLTSIIFPNSTTKIVGTAFSNSKLTTLSIPKNVLDIGNYAFAGSRNLRSIIIENARVDIGINAFSDCTSLENVQFGDSVKRILSRAFYNCTSLRELILPNTLQSLGAQTFYNCINLIKAQIQGSIQTFEGGLFEGCVNLSELQFPNSLIRIEDIVFRNCSKLSKVEFPKTLNSIGNNVFVNCTSLKKINLPSNVTNIGYAAFANCTSLDTVITNAYLPLKTYGDYFLNCNPQTKTLLVPYNTKTLYQDSWYWKGFGNIVESDKGVFITRKSRYVSDNDGDTARVIIDANCKWTVSCNETWVKIDKYSGENKDKIILTVSKNNLKALRKAEITIFDSELRPQIFTLNQFGKKVTLNSTAGNLQIADSLLNTENIKIKGTMDWRDFGTIRYKLQNLNALDLSDVNINEYIIKKTNYWDNDIIYPKNELPGNAFSEKLNRLKLPFTLKSFATNSLIYAGNIQDLYVNFRNPSIINFVSSGVFQHVLNTNLHVPYGTVSIYKNTNIWNTIPVITANDIYLYSDEDSKYFIKGTEEKHVVKVNSNVPWNVQCDSSWVTLRKINTTNGDSLEITVSQNNGYKPRSASIALVSDLCDTYYFNVMQDGTSFNLNISGGTLKKSMPSELKKNLTKLKLSGTMYARDFFFLRDSMPQLQKIDLKDICILSNNDTIWYSYGFYELQKYNAKEIPNYAFYNSNSSTNNTALKSIILPDTVLTIGERAFYNCTVLDNLIVGEFTKTIKNAAFSGCTSLSSFTIPSTVTTIGYDLFYNCTALTNCNILSEIKEIPSGMFQFCKNLKSFEIPTSVAVIGETAFNGCNKLTNIELSDNIKTIGNGAFGNCSSLSEFTIPKNTSTIGDNLLRDCSGLKKCSFLAITTKLPSELFKNCINLKSFDIPRTIVECGYDVFNNCKSLDTLRVFTKTPPKLGYNEFNYVSTSTCKLLVPKGSKVLYANADWWKNFANIIDSIDIPNILLITEPTVVTNKTYDGNTTAVISKLGTLMAVDAADIGNVGVTATANYDNANVGINKTITVIYTLTGSAKDKYKAPENYVIRTAKISEFIPLQISNNPTVVTNKMHDGNTTATISNIGTLQGVEAADIGKVTVSASANYDNANVGINKTITVLYSLAGSAKSKYVAPENFVITNAKISDFITLNTLNNPDTVCEGDIIDLNYSIKTGTPTQYKITFNSEAISAGLQNVSYVNIPTDEIAGALTILSTVYAKGGTYSGILKMKNELNSESPDYPFTLTINVTENRIVTKFDDIILFNNADKRFVAYQWLMNGVEIPGATKQFFQSPVGLIGMYSVKLITANGKTVYTCPKMLSIFSAKAQVRATPNPVKANELCKIEFSGFTDEQLKKANLAIYNMQGVCIYKSNAVQSITELQLPVHGVYIGKVTSAGNDYVFKIMVTK